MESQENVSQQNSEPRKYSVVQLNSELLQDPVFKSLLNSVIFSKRIDEFNKLAQIDEGTGKADLETVVGWNDMPEVGRDFCSSPEDDS